MLNDLRLMVNACIDHDFTFWIVEIDKEVFVLVPAVRGDLRGLDVVAWLVTRRILKISGYVVLVVRVWYVIHHWTTLTLMSFKLILI